MKDAAARLGLRSVGDFVEFPAAACDQPVHHRFQQMASRCPDAPAVRLLAGDITYAELNAAANRAAHRLLDAVGGSRSPIALLLHQGAEAIVWTLASLKAGLCYAPLDQRLPESALRAMIEDLGPGALVAAADCLELARKLAADDLPVIETQAALDRYAAENLDESCPPDSIATIFYTSGSTGAPKGVADSHRNVLHNILRYTNSLKLAPGDVISLVQNPSFSGTVSSLFGALLNGATIAPYDLQGEGMQALSEWLRRAEVTVFHAVPSIFRGLSDRASRFPHVRLIRLEGDRAAAVDVAHFRENFRDDCTLVNGLGATECGLVRQFFVGKNARPEVGEPLPVGYPVADTAVRIVDEQGGELPVGSTGEIAVESRYLAAGYWRNPALTAEKFIALGGELRRYRTGDLGRMGADGCLFHLGRVDQRMRIAGEFVAAADIEKLLLAIPEIAEAAVRDFPDRFGECRLCACVVIRRGAVITVTGLRAALAERIAARHMPSAFVFLEALPHTKDLKIDYAALPLPGRERPALVNSFVAPRNELERQMARLWEDVLEVEPAGVADSFFDLGGDSLRAARFVNLMREKHGRALAVISLFEHRTIGALAAVLESETPTPRDNLAPWKDDEMAFPDHSIAIIGMAGRFPGADTLDQFWDNLRAGRESITFFAGDGSGQNQATMPGTVAGRGLLSAADRFDATLFRLTPRQAQMLDPQQRLWLECVHQALEDSALPLGEFGYAGDNANIGVFVGGRESTYLWNLVGGDREAVQSLLHRSGDEAHQLMISNDIDSIATRTAFVMGFTGPAINVQTACSTSLVAVAQACQGLVSRQCDLAVAGGVTIIFPQHGDYRFEEGGIHSRDGHCRAFDGAASGTVFGDGVGAVVLKRLADARRDGDRIDAVIRGWAVNNDGSAKASFAAPSVAGQAEVIARAQDHARVRPQDVSYVEAHGSGTPIGDPIEFAALERAFRRGTVGRGFCGLGSVKTNVGHLDAAAGIAGLIKTVLALRHREIPPTLHFRKANPEIDLDASPFYINQRLHPWTADSERIAGVSAFGIGGTNCHVVLQQAPAAEINSPLSADPAHLLTLSAPSEAALAALEGCYRDFFADAAAADMAAVAATAQKSRSAYSHRMAVVGKSAEQIRDSLTADRKTSTAVGCWRGKASVTRNPRIGFLFSGQGAQYFGMGRGLYAANVEFRRLLDHCDRLLRGRLERPLLEVMFSGAGAPHLIHRTEYAQAALFALEYALAELLQSWGVKPQVVLGHSIGEYAAACIAGVFTLEEGLMLAASRGRLMQQLPGDGKMLGVVAERAALDPMLQPFASHVSIAAFNSPTRTVLSGAAAAIDRLKAALEARGIYCRELAVSHAFHSPQIAPALAPLRELIGAIELHPPTIELIGNLHGRALGAEVTDPGYWCDQARQPVQFEAGVRAMLEAGCEVFVEIGPDAVLSCLSEEISANRLGRTVPTLRRDEADWPALLETLARLYVGGVPLNWTAIQQGRRFNPVRLPRLPLQRSRYWYDGPLVRAEPGTTAVVNNSAGHPLLGRPIRLPGSAELRFEARFSQTAPHFLKDHLLFGVPLPPAASHFAMLAQAAGSLPGGAPESGQSVRFEDLYLLRPLWLPDGCERDVQLIFRPEAEGWSVELTSAEASGGENAGGEWTTHMIGRSRLQSTDDRAVVEPFDPIAIGNRCPRQLSSSEFYAEIWANQGGTGSAFRWIDSIWQGDREALCRVVCPSGIVDAKKYRLHPGVIEAACQVLHCCATIETEQDMQRSGATYVPFSVDAFYLFAAPASHDAAWCHARLREHGDNNVVADLSIFNVAGGLVGKLEGFRLRTITREAIGDPSARAAAPAIHRILLLDARPAAEEHDQIVSVEEVLRYLRLCCAELSGYRESEIHSDKGLIQMGLDSLAAMVLANRIRRDFGHPVTVPQILMSPSLEALARAICADASA